jgi:hypothetical protein
MDAAPEGVACAFAGLGNLKDPHRSIAFAHCAAIVRDENRRYTGPTSPNRSSPAQDSGVRPLHPAEDRPS